MFCFFYSSPPPFFYIFFFFFNDTATTEIYTLSLHDALPICISKSVRDRPDLRSLRASPPRACKAVHSVRDRKSTRLNSSHQIISYAVFCLKKKKKSHHEIQLRAPQRLQSMSDTDLSSSQVYV